MSARRCSAPGELPLTISHVTLRSAQQQMESEHSSTLTDLTASLDDSKKDLANARSARDLALAEKAAVQEQLSTARQQLDEAHQLLDQGLRRSEALKVELDLVAQ